jgi:hypothetical protein
LRRASRSIKSRSSLAWPLELAVSRPTFGNTLVIRIEEDHAVRLTP